MSRRVAVTREVPRSIAECQLTHRQRVPICLEDARAQHGRYEDTLRACGCRVERLAEEPASADAVFVEDVAIVLAEVAIVTRPGAASRRGETSSVASALEPYRELATIGAPGTVDGGDVLVCGDTLYVGLSSRTNRHGVEQLAEIASRFGYRIEGVSVTACLHLKSAVTQVGEQTLLANLRWIPAGVFSGLEVLEVDPTEPSAANALLVGDRVILSSEHPATLERVAARFAVLSVDVSELAKAEAGVTCCSLVFETGD